MKPIIALVSASSFAFLLISPASASGGCDYGSPDVFKFIRWELAKSEGRWRELTLNFHNTLNHSFSWVELRMLVGDHIISMNTEQRIPAASDAVLTAKYEMSDEAAAEFQSLAPLICVEATDDEKGVRKNYE
jgi:hypothetical protein